MGKRYDTRRRVRIVPVRVRFASFKKNKELNIYEC
jgi:hypothetical protein